MDNLKIKSPLRQYKLVKPLVIVFNIHLSHFNAYGTKHYDRLYKTLTNPDGANMDPSTVYLLPNVTNLSTSIEQRAESISRRLSRLLYKIGASNCHLVAHSFTGIDARASISLFDSHKHVSSLTTICSPHLGSKTLDLYADEKQYGTAENLEKIFEVLGITNLSA